jgi:hypothetical protein
VKKLFLLSLRYRLVKLALIWTIHTEFSRHGNCYIDKVGDIFVTKPELVANDTRHQRKSEETRCDCK